MNEVNVRKIITELRDNEVVRKSFDMAQWVDADHPASNPCGTVGCIAGKTILILEPATVQYDYDWMADGVVQRTARELLGLSRCNANHLFLPNTWVLELLNGNPWSGLSQNEAPSLNTVAEMREWVKEGAAWDGGVDRYYIYDFLYDLITPDAAVNALEGLLSHPGYVNWREALA